MHLCFGVTFIGAIEPLRARMKIWGAFWLVVCYGYGEGWPARGGGDSTLAAIYINVTQPWPPIPFPRFHF